MAYNIVYKKSVKHDLRSLPKADIALILDRIEKDLSKKPEAFPTLKGKFAGLRKYRIDDYRVIFVILEKDVVILRIGHRREVYKRDI